MVGDDLGLPKRVGRHDVVEGLRIEFVLVLGFDLGGVGVVVALLV